jgi:hypothetical protein
MTTECQAPVRDPLTSAYRLPGGLVAVVTQRTVEGLTAWTGELRDGDDRPIGKLVNDHPVYPVSVGATETEVLDLLNARAASLSTETPILVACTMDGCDKPIKSRGWCRSHYTRWLRHKDPTPNS